MEQIATVQPTPRRAERNASAQTAAALLSDPFLLIFQQMMETSTVADQGEEPPEEAPAEAEGQQEAAVAQVLNGVLLNGTPTPVVLDKTQELPNAQAAPAVTQALPSAPQSQSPPAVLIPLAVPVTQAETPVAPSAQTATAEPPPIPILQAEYRTQSGETQTGAHSEQGYDAPSQFKSQQGVAEVKRQLASARSTLRTQSGDSDAAAPAAIQPHPPAPSASLTQKAEQIAAEPRLLDQLKTGLKEHLPTDKSEFTMKLKPESLGEITVKLTEKAGKTTLTIITASAQTAKLINADLSALREAVRPMQVEVREAIPQQTESPQAQMHQFDMSGQQHLFQQQQQQQHSDSRYHGASFPQESESLPPDEHLDTALLDTYI